jgi:4-carboxymuconolactone decarboxylase
MTVLAMDPSSLPPAGRALFAAISAKRKAHGEDFGGPYIALLNHRNSRDASKSLAFF